MRGVDNTAELAQRSFKRLGEILDKLHKEADLQPEFYKNLSSCLSNAQTYLRSHYSYNLDMFAKCRSHCISWLCSDDKNQEFDQVCEKDGNHLDSCHHCHQLPELMQCINGVVHDTYVQQKIDAPTYQEMTYDIQEGFEAISDQKTHIIRTFVQSCEWSRLYHSKLQDTGFLTIDWAM